MHVRQDNTIWYKNKQLNLTQLTYQLKAAKKDHPKAVPQLYHDKKGHFGTYQGVKNALGEAGFEQVDIILKPN